MTWVAGTEQQLKSKCLDWAPDETANSPLSLESGSRASRFYSNLDSCLSCGDTNSWRQQDSLSGHRHREAKGAGAQREENDTNLPEMSRHNQKAFQAESVSLAPHFLLIFQPLIRLDSVATLEFYKIFLFLSNTRPLFVSNCLRLVSIYVHSKDSSRKQEAKLEYLG